MTANQDSLRRILEALGAFVKPRPASRTELAALAAVAPSQELATLYAWGANLDAMPPGDEAPEWLSLRDARSELAALRKLANFSRDLFPIAGDGAGNFSCFALTSGKVVDWDHETQKSRVLAPSLAAYVERQLLRAARQRARLAKREAAERRRGPIAVMASPARPSKLTRIPRTDLAKLDQRGRAGGARCALLLTGSRVFVGVQNAGYVVDLDARTEVHLGRGAVRAAYAATAERILTLDESVCLFDAKTATLIAQWSGEFRDVFLAAIAISSDGAVAAAGTNEGKIAVWPLKGAKPPKSPEAPAPECKPRHVFDAGKQMVMWLAFSPDGTLLATGDYNNTVRVFDVRTGRTIRTSKRAGGLGGAFSPDGSLLATSDDHAITLWDAKGRSVRRWKSDGVPRFVTADVLATAGNRIALWDVATGKRITAIPFSKQRTYNPSLSCLGATIVTCGPLGLYSIA